MHQERTNKHANDDAVPDGAVPAYLLDREGVSRAKVLSNTVKQKRKEKAGKWDVPIPKVRVTNNFRCEACLAVLWWPRRVVCGHHAK